MASDGESDLSEVPTVASNPFTIARSVASSVNPAQHTRFRENRRPFANPQNRLFLEIPLKPLLKILHSIHRPNPRFDKQLL